MFTFLVIDFAKTFLHSKTFESNSILLEKRQSVLAFIEQVSSPMTSLAKFVDDIGAGLP